MINVSSVHAPEAILGRSGFELYKPVRVKNKTKKHLKRKLRSTSFDDRLNQNLIISRVDAWSEQLNVLDCTAEFTISSSNGKTEVKGNVLCLERDFKNVELVVEALINIADSFSQSFRESSFELTHSQFYEKSDD